MRGRWAGFGYAYLACAMFAAMFILAEVYSDLRAAEEGEARPGQALFQALVAAAVFGLFAIPIRLLLCVFPEPSSHSLVRMCRRVVLGGLCGPIPVFVVLGLANREPHQDVLLPVSVAFGLIVGLMDSVVRDRKPEPGDDGE